METKYILTDDDDDSEKLSRQALSFFLHIVIALGAWLAFMMAGYALNPSAVPQAAILLMSIAVPLAVGFFLVRSKPDDMAQHVWLAGLIWTLVVSLWILDMPTGPNACDHCGAVEKLSRTLFSFPRPSGLLDDNGPFLCTWPAAALLGYSIGAHLSLRRRKSQ